MRLRGLLLAVALSLVLAGGALAAGFSSWGTGKGNSNNGLTWFTAGFTLTDFNSLANGSVVVAASAIGNSTALDLYADVSGSLVVGGTTTTSSYLSLYILPLNQDGTTYGGGTATGGTLPVAQYLVATVGVPTGITSGSAVTFQFRGIVLPPGDFKWAVANNLGVALNASAVAAVQNRTYRENLNN